MSTHLIEREEVRTTDNGSHDKFTHIVVEGWWTKDEDFIPETPVVDGIVNGTPVRALCGKVWVPGDNVGKYGLCPTCIEIAKEQGWKVPSQ